MKGGAKTIVLKDGISRGPALEMDSLDSVKRLVDWVADKANFSLLQRAFAATSPYVHLDAARVHAAGRLAFLRFVCRTGDAMGMNMVGCGTERALRVLRTHFPHTQPITYPLTHSLTLSLSHSLTLSLIHSLIHSFTHSFISLSLSLSD